MLLQTLENVRFLSRHGFPLRGNNKEGNFDQMLMHASSYDPRLAEWLQKERGKYTHPDSQNQFLKIMSLSILRKIASNIQNGIYYTIMTDEVTDASNDKQFVLCLRSVDDDLFPHEDLIGLYKVPNICANTLVSCIRDALIRMNLSMNKCRDQGPGAKTGVSTQIKSEEPRAIFTHCYGHSLQLAVGDTIKGIKNLVDMFDTTAEISKLLKFSAKRDATFDRIKEAISPETSDFRVLCPTRWTVRAACLQSVIDNWKVLQELWEECLESKLEREIRAQIIGVNDQITTFEYDFGIKLGSLLLRHSDNLPKALQKINLSAAEGQSIASLTVKTLEKMQTDDSYHLFWERCNKEAKDLKIGEAVLPRKRQRPFRYYFGSAPAEFLDSVENHY